MSHTLSVYHHMALPAKVVDMVNALHPSLRVRQYIRQANRLQSQIIQLQKSVGVLKAQQSRVVFQAQQICPHGEIRYEDNGDCHNFRWEKYCKLCNAYL